MALHKDEGKGAKEKGGLKGYRMEHLEDNITEEDQVDFGPPWSLVSSFGFSGVPSSSDLTPPLKFLMALPSPDPISGSRLAPKIRKTMARMMISSWDPIPNNFVTSLDIFIPVYFGCDILSRVKSEIAGEFHFGRKNETHFLIIPDHEVFAYSSNFPEIASSPTGFNRAGSRFPRLGGIHIPSVRKPSPAQCRE